MNTKLLATLFLALFLLGCTTVPSEPENGPTEPEPVPGPAPEPEPGEGRIMGYPPTNGDRCSSRAAHKYAEPEGYSDALCYDAANFARWCQNQIYQDEGQCAAANGGRK